MCDITHRATCSRNLDLFPIAHRCLLNSGRPDGPLTYSKSDLVHQRIELENLRRPKLLRPLTEVLQKKLTDSSFDLT